VSQQVDEFICLRTWQLHHPCGALTISANARSFVVFAHESGIVLGATDLFEETRALGSAAGLACAWFPAHLPAQSVS
jgi:hypothetical protein